MSIKSHFSDRTKTREKHLLNLNQQEPETKTPDGSFRVQLWGDSWENSRAKFSMRIKNGIFFIQKSQKVCSYDLINDDIFDRSLAVGPVGVGCGTLAQVWPRNGGAADRWRCPRHLLHRYVQPPHSHIHRSWNTLQDTKWNDFMYLFYSD